MPDHPPHMAIDLAHVAKTYRGRRGGVQALRGIEMRVHRGEVFGLLGPNGAGKSTLIKILMTVIRPSQCRGTLLGARVGDKSALARVGYLPEHHRFPDYLKGEQVLDFYGGLSGVPRRDRRRRSAHLLELVGLSGERNWGRMRVRQYSKGMRQRLGIAQALINDPELVLLDEPTDGVDPVGRRDIRDIVAHLKQEGRTVFLNSHLLSELEMVCDRVAILVKGVVHQQGTLDELTRDEQRYEIELEADFGTAARLLAGIDHPSGVQVRGSTLTVGTPKPEAVQPMIDTLRARGAIIRSVRPHRPSLEDLFMKAVTDPTTGATLRPGAGGPPPRHTPPPLAPDDPTPRASAGSGGAA